MFRFAAILILLPPFVSLTNAQEQKFPYKAKITADEVYVRSGAGEAFYPTASLKRDASVTVRRHDPGGWYMIDPPQGSFSWIPSKYVQQTSTESGNVLESNVVVFVGSAFGDETHVWQRRLMAGEKVRILDEKSVETLSGPKQMYRIAPPAREYRWVPGSSVVPTGAAAKARRDKDPYSVPSHLTERSRPTTPTPAANSPETGSNATAPQQPASSFSPSNRLVKLKRIRDEQRQLHQLDQQFRTMILSDPSQWDLEKLEQSYLELQEKVTHKPVAGQIDLRYPAIRRYRQRKAEYDDLNRLTSETERRDAELLARQFGMGTTAGNVSAVSSSTMLPEQQAHYGVPQPTSVDFDQFGQQPAGTPMAAAAPTATQGLMLPGFQSVSQPNGSMLIPNIDSAFTTTDNQFPTVPAGSTQFPTESPMTTLPSSTSPPSATAGYTGAGYVQRATESEGSGYILLSTAGKVLAHLNPSGNVDLEPHIGHAVGVKGRRYFDKSIESDRIDVNGLEDVTIR